MLNGFQIGNAFPLTRPTDALSPTGREGQGEGASVHRERENCSKRRKKGRAGFPTGIRRSLPIMPKVFALKAEHRLPLQYLLHHHLRRQGKKLELFRCRRRGFGVRFVRSIHVRGPVGNGFMRYDGINSVFLCHSERFQS